MLGLGRDRRAAAVATAAVRGEGKGGPCGSGGGNCVDGGDAYADTDARRCRRGSGGAICLGREALYRREVPYSAWLGQKVWYSPEANGLGAIYLVAQKSICFECAD